MTAVVIEHGALLMLSPSQAAFVARALEGELADCRRNGYSPSVAPDMAATAAVLRRFAETEVPPLVPPIDVVSSAEVGCWHAITATDLAHRNGLSREYVNRLCRRGVLVAQQEGRGRPWLIDEEDAQRWERAREPAS